MSDQTHSTLHDYLAMHRAQSDAIVDWPQSRLRLRAYRTQLLPPDALITSVRAVVSTAQEVLVLRNPHETHILPGGRREPGESFLETLQREIWEESGWIVAVGPLLGVRHFQHLTPRPPQHASPYPDFFQLVYYARPVRHDPAHQHTDSYEEDAAMLHRSLVARLALPADQRVFL